MSHGPLIIGIAVLTGAGFNWLWYYVFPDAGAMDILAIYTALLLGVATAVRRILAPKKQPYRRPDDSSA